ncbi:MAG: ATP-dependent DNA helicase RecG [Clostridia bacterium]|nr:ATP-dependent DNA helicase RecG [Clostridia bacterium]
MTKALSLRSPVSSLKGVGKVREEILIRNGIDTVEKLLFYFPRSYRSGRIFPLGEERVGAYSGFHLTLLSSAGYFTGSAGVRCIRFLAADEEGTRVQVIYPRQLYLKKCFVKGDSAYFFGILQKKSGQYYLFSPERKETAPDPKRLYPVYSPIGSVSSRRIGAMISDCLVPCLPEIRENLPEAVRQNMELISKADAVLQMHSPSSEESMKKARERFLFEELFSFSVSATLFSRKQSVQRIPAMQKADPDLFFKHLPFALTDAQERVLNEIFSDLTGSGPIPPMNRLVQGDVGSGKTVVAAAAAFLCAANGKSTLLMAPTEILARQHAASFEKMFSFTDIPVFCLTGSAPKKKREEIYAVTTGNNPYILIGTHALTEDGTLCRNVALAITDEQHRFGVRQRSVLGEKGGAMHSLVMSATPIPRSLALFLYQKSKISVIDRLPPGRQKIETLYVGEDKMDRIYSFLEEKAREGQQAYLVCPLIEDDEENPLRSATEEFSHLKKRLPEIPVALLHGKMKPAEKNSVMEAFQKGDVRILVSTTVIEVGVDVPAATVMVIRNAERFGLSQLHQLRGRVGRGKQKSYCVLVSSHDGKKARERLRKLCDCHDGFELARFDLETRGPGEFFGTRQSGFEGPNLFEGISMPYLQRVADCTELFLNTASPEEILPYESAAKLN